MSAAFFCMGLLVLALQAPARAEMTFKHIPTQFIAALGDPGATSGTNARSWGLWQLDPGPRGVWLANYDELKAAGGLAPARWKFDSSDWWLEENGLIMEKPDFPVPPGSYMVTGGREITTLLTIHPADKDALSGGSLLTTPSSMT